MKKHRNYNISLIGDAFVGKTAIARALTMKPFQSDYTSTIGASMVKIEFKEENALVTFTLWDTAGTEKYKSLAPVYYRDSKIALVVFDVSNESSFDHVQSWIDLYYQYVDESNPIIVIGNKTDLDKFPLFETKVEEWNKQKNYPIILVSALSGDNIQLLCPAILENLDKANVIPSERKNKNENNNNKSMCC